jgi:hypothetical protein
MRWLTERIPLIIGIATVVAMAFIAYVLGGVMSDLTEINERMEARNELRTHQLCESQNEMRIVLAAVLDALAEPRDSDEPGDHAQRMRLREQVDPYVQPQDCPPPPDRSD